MSAKYLHVEVSFRFLETYVVVSREVWIETGKVDLSPFVFIPSLHWKPTGICLSKKISSMTAYLAIHFAHHLATGVNGKENKCSIPCFPLHLSACLLPP